MKREMLKLWIDLFSEIIEWDEFHKRAQKIRSAMRIARPPGYRILSILDFLYSKKTMTTVFEPLLADLHHEYYEALNQNRQWKARWIRVRYSWTFSKTIGLQSTVSLIKQIIGAFKTTN